MTQEMIGKIIAPAQQRDAHRDAVHLAVAPVTAAESLSSGQHIGHKGNGKFGVVPACIGIVDPFLTEQVKPGDKFWLFLYPNTITSLRHDWTHPAFYKDVPVSSTAEIWIRDFADAIDVGYGELMAHAEHYVNYGEYWVEGGRFEGISLPDEFWPYYEEVTGISVADDKRASFFSCSC
jgi:hypothetical protein